MERIIIAISKLSRDNWRAIYKFIKNIVTDANIDTKKSALESLQSISNGIRFKSSENPETAKDVYSLYGMEISDNSLIGFKKNTCFCILYQKENESEDFTELVPFVLLQHEFGDAISLGIDIGQLESEKQNNYKFKCSDFFIIYDIKKPRLGDKCLYFINEKKIDKSTGELNNIRISSFSGKKESSTYYGNSSRRFLPLINITEDNYKSIFGKNSECGSKEFDFVKGSINKIREEWEKKSAFKRIWPTLKSIFDSKESLFVQWIECGYFYSFGEGLKDIKTDEIQGIRNTLEIYKNSIIEIVQNIIFMGGKKGFCIVSLTKKEIYPTVIVRQ